MLALLGALIVGLALGLTGAALIMGVRFSRVVHRAVPLS